MMPGENQSKAGGIASEATPGTCQNCTVLNQVRSLFSKLTNCPVVMAIPRELITQYVNLIFIWLLLNTTWGLSG